MVTSDKKAKIIKEHRLHEKDTGSASVQISLLNQRIKELAQHLKYHSKDVHSRRGLLQMISTRRKLEKSLGSSFNRKSSSDCNKSLSSKNKSKIKIKNKGKSK